MNTEGKTPLDMALGARPRLKASVTNAARALIALGATEHQCTHLDDRIKEAIDCSPLTHAVRTFNAPLVIKCLEDVKDAKEENFREALDWIKRSKAGAATDVRALLQAHGAKLSLQAAMTRAASARGGP